MQDPRTPCYNPAMIQGIEHVAIASANPEKLAQWYVEHLDFHVNFKPVGINCVFIKAPGGFMIEIIAANDSARGAVNLTDAGLRHLAITVTDFDAAHQRMKDAGVKFLTERTTVGGNTTVFFTDPEGNILHLLHREQQLP